MCSAREQAEHIGRTEGNQRLTLALLFLFPFFPDVVLCLLAGLTGYSWSWFAVMVLLTRPWGTIVSALVGSGSLSIPLWGWAILVVAAVAAMVFSIKYGSRMEDLLLEKIRGRKKGGKRKRAPHAPAEEGPAKK